ncbi:MAG: FAD-dependent oxidoreductase [Ruminococcaceae bacterium]|nr:FAD-dependent oxidoreductase [Oscillospiraceae bacterium]
MNRSVWSEEVRLPEFQALQGDVKTDVLIIGGGLCGILCAYFLKQAGVDYLLVEGNTIASGVTKNTTAKITSQHGLIYDKLLGNLGKEKAQMYLAANQAALLEYERLCQDIECEFEKKPSYVYSITNRAELENEVKAVNALGLLATFYEETELPLRIEGAVCFPQQAQFHPLRFIAGLAKDLHIYEHTFIREVMPGAAVADGGKITAKKIIVTTHFPFINKHGGYFIKLYQHRSYVSAFQNAQALEGMYVDENMQGLSFRTYRDLLLIGGGSHRTGKQGGNWRELEAFAGQHYPEARLQYKWATQDCMSLDSIPYIGLYSKRTPALYVATGFSKWGMTSSMAAAAILCDMVQDKQNDVALVFSPGRSILKPQLLVNGLETTASLLTPTPKRCPHLGCALKWNKAERSWDCPCHGSRFEEDGRLIDNPATGDIKKVRTTKKRRR